MTRKELRAAHVAMWTWLADHPGKGKTDWPGWKQLGIVPHMDDEYRHACFACAATWRACDDDEDEFVVDCRDCPIKWNGEPDDDEMILRSVQCEDDDAEYHKWDKLLEDPTAENLAEASEIAREIAGMWPEE